MFSHIYLSRLKVSLRDREMIFWTFMFPILLATFFVMSFSGLSVNEQFRTIPIAVVDDAAYQQDVALQQTLLSVSENGQSAQPMETPLFDLQVLRLADAGTALENGDIAGYLVAGDPITVVVRQSGVYQTIIKIFADEYLQTASAAETIISRDPAAATDLPERIGNRIDLLADKPVSSADPDNTLIYFYALIAMTCLYGGFWGLREVMAVQANLTNVAARINLAPVHKMKVFVYSLAAALTVHYASLLVLVAYLGLVHGISFGEQTGLILLACLSGSLTGISIGAFIGAVSRQSEAVKTAQLIAVSMIFSFLAGLMIVDIKYIVIKAVPALRWLNPGNLISESFYAIYFFDTTGRYWLNIGLQILLVAILFAATAVLMRRRRYASI